VAMAASNWANAGADQASRARQATP